MAVAAGLLASGCASAPIGDAALADLARAEALILEGCYDCLIEARDAYARVGVGRARPLVVARLFESEVLIALRERELALDSAEAEARAASLVPELPPEVDGDRVLAAVRAVLPDKVGVSKERMSGLRRAPPRRGLDVAGELTWLRSVPLSTSVRRYVEMSFDCAFDAIRGPAGRPFRPLRERPEVADDAPPLLRYRAAICFGLDAEPLERILEASPRFVEAAYFVARSRLVNAQNNGAPGTRPLLEQADERFPSSPAVSYVYGNFLQLIGDCREAVRFYAATLDLEAAHEAAQLGQVVCLSFLKAHDEAIAEAGTLLDWGRYHIPEAYYWRAWNHHVQGNLPAARENIESAKKIASTGEIHTLAGVIEHDQHELGPAEKDLGVALGLAYGNRNCTAMWYLGLVHMKQERWPDSAGAFEQAMDCYRQNVLESEAALRTMERRTDVDPDFKVSQIAGFQVAIKEDRAQYHAAAFNAANQHTRGGNIARARELIEVAAKDPALADLVGQLREILRKIGGGAP